MDTNTESCQTCLEQFIINRLNQLMEERNLSRYKLCKLCGITQASLSVILSGKCAPSISTLDKICNGLGIHISDFLDKDNDTTKYILSDDDLKVLKCWNTLDDLQKKIVFAYAEGMIAQKKLK